MKIDLKSIIAESKKVGLDLVSFTGAEFLYSEYERLKDWQNKGFAAGMSYMLRPADLLSDPKRLLPNAKSILVFALHYDRRKLPDFKKGFGKVARYAWGRDYHTVIRERLKLLFENLKINTHPEVEFRVFSDAVPLLERALGSKAGLGFVGKNSMLIKPRSGSYFFIAEIISNLEILGNALPVLDDNCGGCRNCINSCPTDAIVKDHVVDAGRCISYLTIEKKGTLNIWEREAIGNWIFGCDACQEICPFNHKSLKEEVFPALEDFSFENGVGALLNLKTVLSIREKAEFNKRFSHTALMRAGRESLLRNAAIVAANTVAEDLAEDLMLALAEDKSEVVRASCLWSLSKLNRKCNILSKESMDSLMNKAFHEESKVRDEFEYF